MEEELDESLVNDFIVESRDHLNNIEPAMLAMEQQGASVDSETVNLVFRAMHTIKGSASFLKFNAVKELSHALESVLGLVRDGKLKVTPELMDILLAGVDKLRQMMEDVKKSDGVDIRKELEKLHEVVVPGETAAPVEAKAASTLQAREGMQLNTPAIRVAVKQGMHFFLIKAFMEKDLRQAGTDLGAFIRLLGSFGKVFGVATAQNFDPEFSTDIASEIHVDLLFASVLELDLIAGSLPVPVCQVQVLDL